VLAGCAEELARQKPPKAADVIIKVEVAPYCLSRAAQSNVTPRKTALHNKAKS